MYITARIYVCYIKHKISMQIGGLSKTDPIKNALHLNYAGPFSVTPPDKRAPSGQGSKRARETLRPGSNHRFSRQPVRSSFLRSRPEPKSRSRPKLSLRMKNRCRG